MVHETKNGFSLAFTPAYNEPRSPNLRNSRLMTLQLALVILIVAGAIAYLGWSGWRTLRAKRGCGGGSCACPAPTESTQAAKLNGLISSDELTLRRPKSGPA